MKQQNFLILGIFSGIIVLGLLIWLITKKKPSQSYERLKTKGYFLDEMSKQELEDFKKGQATMTDILKVVDYICRKYDIKYWIIKGTLLGAIRHHGWIPHDGDVDIAMIREDYNRFKLFFDKELLVLKQERKERNYWLQDPETDKYWKKFKCSHIIAQIKSLDYCYIDDSSHDVHNGIKIDIFEYEFDGQKLIPVGGEWEPCFKEFQYEDIFPLKEVDFEDIKVYAPNTYDKILRDGYGANIPHELPLSEQYPDEGRIGVTSDWIKKKYPHLYG